MKTDRRRNWLFRRKAETRNRVCVTGALRSGTNYLKFLLENNYEVHADFSAFGWKHGGVPIFPIRSEFHYPVVPIVFIVKNPYAFVISLHRYFRRKAEQSHKVSIVGREEFGEFLTNPITIFDSQLPGSPQMRFANPLQYWNFVYWNLEMLDPKRFKAIGFNYEDLLSDPERLRSIESVASFRGRSGSLATPQKQLRRLGKDGRDVGTEGYESDAAFDPSYYTEKRYLESFTLRQLSYIRSQADPLIMKRRGYDTI